MRVEKNSGFETIGREGCCIRGEKKAPVLILILFCINCPYNDATATRLANISLFITVYLTVD